MTFSFPGPDSFGTSLTPDSGQPPTTTTPITQRNRASEYGHHHDDFMSRPTSDLGQQYGTPNHSMVYTASSFITPLHPSNKRARMHSNASDVEMSIGCHQEQRQMMRPLGLQLMTVRGEQLGDLAEYLQTVEDNVRHLKGNLESKEETITNLLSRVNLLETKVQALEDDSDEETPKARKRKEQDVNLIVSLLNQLVETDLKHYTHQNAIHAAAKALIGVQEVRVDGQDCPVLILPHPLPAGEPHRMDIQNNRLWNPEWRAENATKNTYNIEFVKAMVSYVIDNAKVSYKMI